MFVHGAAERQAALELIARGLDDCEVARRLGIPRRTVRDWRVQPYTSKREVCWRCWGRTSAVRLAPADYAELLGLYLGDGHITQMARAQRLRLMLDAKYPGIVSDATALLARVIPENKVGQVRSHGDHMVTVQAYHGHWSCLLPQHGPGKKHERAIRLEPWQQDLLSAAPWWFLRGCIRSDGCVFINRTGQYAYESYDFCNRSADIRGLFAATCALVGVDCRPAGDRVRIYRRPSVELMLEHVGRKA
jgi:hypothetical protein